MVAEADFRLDVGAPVLTLAVALGVSASAAWGLLAFVTPVLAVQALRKQQNARLIMTQFVAQRAVFTAPALAMFDAVVNDLQNIASGATC
jgi:hypothetical protein